MDWNRRIKNLVADIAWDIYKDKSDPLDGDDTERLGKLLTLELDINQGNITQGEYNEMLARIEKP